MSKLYLKVLFIVICLVAFVACDKGKSYAELLRDENVAVNNFLADQRVINKIPEDSVFESGVDAPYYKMDDDGNIYMQVIRQGDKENMAENDEEIYFRFTRYDLYYYTDGNLPEGWGNANDHDYISTSFRFGNYTLPSSSQWGSAIQLPLYYLGIGCEVRLVVKSQYGFTNEISNVIPYLYNVSYNEKAI